jgi:hypothetical protein
MSSVSGEQRVITVDAVSAELRRYSALFLSSVVMVCVLVGVLVTGDGVAGPWPWVVAMAVVLGTVAARTVPAAQLRPLDEASATTGGELMRTAGFLALALCEAPALVGVVGSFAADNRVPVAIGLLGSVTAFVVAAPWPGRVAEWVGILEAKGAKVARR